MKKIEITIKQLSTNDCILTFKGGGIPCRFRRYRCKVYTTIMEGSE